MGLFGRKKSVDPDGDGAAKSDDVVVQPMVWRDDPEMNASILSALTFMWVQPMFSRAAYLRKNGKWLELDDLAPLAEPDKSENVEVLFEEAYESYVPKKKGKVQEGGEEGGGEGPEELERRLVHALIATCRRRIIVGGIFRLFNSALQFSFPILLNLILSYYQDVQSGKITKDDPPMVYYKGYWLSALLMAFVGSKAITESAYFHRMNRCSWRMKTAISSSVYRKSLRLASSEQQKTTLGEIVNLMQVDATKIETFMLQFHTLWDGLFQIAGYMTILGFLLGWTCLIGLVLIILAIPIMGKITGNMFGLNRSMVKYTDERVKTANEALQGILCVKMYTWEEPLSKQIDSFRQQELASLKRIAYFRAFTRAYMSALPTFACAATFLVYVYATDRSVTASTLFAAIVAFDMLRMPLMFYPMALAQYAQCKVSLRRVGVFLGYDEVNKKGYTRNPDADGEVIVENATLYWSDPNKPLPKSALQDSSALDNSTRSSVSGSKKSRLSMRSLHNGTTKSDVSMPETTVEEEELVYPNPVLSDVNIHVSTGELCAIVGPVGSGKTTLCASILNETVLADGSHITLNGKVAYVSQTAWIMNKTVRDNILFDLPYDEDKYNKVLDACCLKQDLEILEDGDMTEIGERGINLSGGQKQRLSLARAAYSDATVFLFDDPLSALDPEVAETVFDQCILGMLEGKTRLLVTNQLQCLARCNTIIALGRHGTVLEQGAYDDVMTSKGEVSRLLRGVTPSTRRLSSKQVTEDTASPSTKEKEDLQKEGATLMTKEERETGSVSFGVYLKYVQAGGGYFLYACVLFTYILSTGTNVLTSVWVSVWTADSNYRNQTETFYIVGYALCSVLLGVMAFIRSYGLASFGVRSSFHLHGSVLRSVFHAPMWFFDTTPTGRILSRFSKDMHTVDHEIADYVDIFIFIVLQLFVVMISIVVITPFFAVALPFLAFFYIYAMNYFRRVSRETKRLESVARSPVYSHFSETLGGLTTIRAFGKSEEFTSAFDTLLDTNTRTIYCNKAADRWLATRLESIAAAVCGCAALFATQVVVSNGASVGDASSFASLAGISLSYAVTATGMMQFVVRSFAQVESAMNSVERVTHYIDNIPQEAAMTSEELECEKPSSPMNAAQNAVAATGTALHPTEEWPENGAITLNNLQMRYRTETPLVLKGLNVSIGAGERVGVVGRTGSGKSSMLLVLMRIVEPYLSEDVIKKYEAPLTIDGVDTLRIGLRDLRSKLGIIPQLPVLFSGTIRSNLDPFQLYSDEEIWNALEKCRMKDAVDKMEDGLQSRVAEYGENLSQGQRQLLCLGRALLRRCQILLLDEATSSVDFETDKKIQTTIREAFKGCTIITIAHRVNTILDSDKILVMDNGTVGEFDSPTELLKNKSSLFSEIVSHSNGDTIDE